MYQHAYVIAAQIVQDLGLLRVPTHGNEDAAYSGTIERPDGMIAVRVEMFPAETSIPAWASITLALGSVKHLWPNRTPLGEFGLLGATYDAKTGSWATWGCAPQSRTWVPAANSLLQHSTDIVDSLITYAPLVVMADAEMGDLAYGTWDIAIPGW